MAAGTFSLSIMNDMGRKKHKTYIILCSMTVHGKHGQRGMASYLWEVS